MIVPALRSFREERDGADARRRERVRLCFGLDGLPWDEERVLERYELLYEAGLVEEAKRDGRAVRPRPKSRSAPSMIFDHRRILATAIARLRGKMKYRPVVFELMPPQFTLLELQRTVEAISGVRLHKQNFRRLVEGQGLVEGTGKFARAVARAARRTLPLPPRSAGRAPRARRAARQRALRKQNAAHLSMRGVCKRKSGQIRTCEKSCRTRHRCQACPGALTINQRRCAAVAIAINLRLRNHVLACRPRDVRVGASRRQPKSAWFRRRDIRAEACKSVADRRRC